MQSHSRVSSTYSNLGLIMLTHCLEYLDVSALLFEWGDSYDAKVHNSPIYTRHVASCLLVLV